MYKHHEESIKAMTAHYREIPHIQALFLVGSIATGEEREDSDIDGVAIIPNEEYKRMQETTGTLEVIHGKCTYEGGYFDIHYFSPEALEDLAQNGSEPMRNLFRDAQTLFCNEPRLAQLATEIQTYPKEAASEKQFKFYCTLKQWYRYFWVICKPQSFARFHAADGIIFNLYRLILIENKILFPSMRKLEETVAKAPNKPQGIMETTARFMKTLSDEDCRAIIESYENWTTYDFPKDQNTIMNNFADKWEWD